VTEKDRKERDRRLDMVRRYVPAYRSYYGGFWWYLTSPWGGEPEFLGEWIS